MGHVCLLKRGQCQWVDFGLVGELDLGTLEAVGGSDSSSPVNSAAMSFVFSNEGDAIKVFVRIRPPTEGSGSADGEQNLCLSVLSSTTLRLHSNPEPKTFMFDHVANMDTTQVMMIWGAPLFVWNIHDSVTWENFISDFINSISNK